MTLTQSCKPRRTLFAAAAAAAVVIHDGKDKVCRAFVTCARIDCYELYTLYSFQYTLYRNPKLSFKRHHPSWNDKLVSYAVL